MVENVFLFFCCYPLFSRFTIITNFCFLHTLSKLAAQWEQKQQKSLSLILMPFSPSGGTDVKYVTFKIQPPVTRMSRE